MGHCKPPVTPVGLSGSYPRHSHKPQIWQPHIPPSFFPTFSLPEQTPAALLHMHKERRQFPAPGVGAELGWWERGQLPAPVPHSDTGVPTPPAAISRGVLGGEGRSWVLRSWDV